MHRFPDEIPLGPERYDSAVMPSAPLACCKVTKLPTFFFSWQRLLGLPSLKGDANTAC